MQLLGASGARGGAVSAVTAARHTHGLVIGGGLTGLLAARVLANHLDRVTLLDRQPLPRLPALGAGAARAVYPHVHAARGPGSLETLLPGLTSELMTSGAARIDPARDVTWLPACGAAAAAPALAPASAPPVLTCSRELVEWHARRRVSMLPGVHLLEGVEVFALSTTGPRRVVNGVHVRASGHAPSHLRDTIFAADFIVDATGDEASADHWLHQLGFPMPSEQCELAAWSASAVFTPPHTVEAEAISVKGAIGARALLLPIERRRMMIALSDTWPSEPPVDAASFLARVRALAHPAVIAALPHADQLGPIAVRRDERRDTSDRLAPGAWPARFVSFGATSRWPDLGDAASTTTLGLAAHTLDRLIGARDRSDHTDRFAGVASAFQRALARLGRAGAGSATTATRQAC